MADTMLTQKDYEILASFRYELRQYLNFSEEAARRIGLTHQRYTALLYLAGFSKGDEMTIGALAERLLVKHNSAVGLVNRLAAEGLVRRIPSQKDQRQVCVEITPGGRDYLEQLAMVHKEELQRIGPQLRQLLRDMGNMNKL